ncbi:Type I restriction modification DNA specificity domain protein [Corynebacterium capitovis DSM 44611]|uniref:restriction endonuclease subunit S n=1 Tax=Corynebacterium capitovis TaxID=131081 RepID=UPI00036D0A6C|nr:restriction endonuclease subunit S [Corynebacterium capitovis]WKD56892.1 Type I restriction modification DNA specificity domain protein [Corynebacterium capitovis DSM 44611]
MLDTSSWKGFLIGGLFDDFQRGKANQTKLEEGTDLFYVGAKRDDNGVMLSCAYDETLVSPGNCVVFISNGQGSVGYANYMDVDFVASTDLILGYADWLNPSIGLFLATVFSLERPKYSFGRKWGRFLQSTVVQLPIQYQDYGSPVIDSSKSYHPEGYVPDWGYMERFIQNLDSKPISTENTAPVVPLSTRAWVFFLLKDLCSIDMGNKMDFSAMSTDSPTINFVGRSADNNGVVGIVDSVEDVDPYPAGSLTVALGGSLGSTFYQAHPFYTAQNVSVLQFDTEQVSPYARLFLATMIEFESRFKYFPFGRELNKYIRTIYGFELPVQRDENGCPVIDPAKTYHPEGFIPDWEFMENYIRSLPYGDRIPESDGSNVGIAGE